MTIPLFRDNFPGADQALPPNRMQVQKPEKLCAASRTELPDLPGSGRIYATSWQIFNAYSSAVELRITKCAKLPLRQSRRRTPRVREHTPLRRVRGPLLIDQSSKIPILAVHERFDRDGARLVRPFLSECFA